MFIDQFHRIVELKQKFIRQIRIVVIFESVVINSYDIMFTVYQTIYHSHYSMKKIFSLSIYDLPQAK